MITPSSASSKDIAEMLLEEGLITPRQLEKAIEQQKNSNESLEKIIIGLGYVTEKEVTEVIGKEMGVPFIDLDEVEIDPELARAIPEHLAQRYKVIPVGQENNKLALAMVDPLNVFAIDDIRLITGFDIEPMISTEESIIRAINKQFGVTDLAEVHETVQDIALSDFGDLETLEEEEEMELDKLKELVDEAPIVRVVNLIITQAINDKASDIHIEPRAKNVCVRYRIDGVLHEVMSPPKHIQAPMVSRIKIMASLDIAERRIPQDGKIHLKHDNKEYDLRVSSLPTSHGEKIVMRILDKSSVMIGLDKLGLMPDTRAVFEDLVFKPYGMILVTGPTGSGKSTTLYTALNMLNSPEVNICTVEDPVEYQLPGINQVQINPKAGLHFSTALRSFLRQDPDIIMVGEIRDQETAQIAIESALTGHLVLSTLHTNDAPGAITRLIDMGIEPFLVASALVGVIAQRLVRRICPNCRESYTPPEEAVAKFGLNLADTNIVFYHGRGCEHCKGTGYKGRSGIYEMMTINENVRPLILRNAPTVEVKDAAIENGMVTLQEDGLRKVLEGTTTIEECLRVVYVGEEM
ncbi:MAG TPA: type IV-A pilus assembly ATPase PilB [Candidatus Eremiobacteraeota bacterium]|nr:type IV-A pilus assembly ATPase PilB [Candidatus Eremiobacteraeota bacterium]